jgi:hypothetical protein
VQHEPQRIQQQGRQDNDAKEIGSIANQRGESEGSETGQKKHWGTKNGKQYDVFKQYWMTEIATHRKATVFPDWSILAQRYMSYKKGGRQAYHRRKEKQAIQKKKYRQRPEVKARHAERQRKYCEDPFFRVKKNLRRRLCEVAKSGKAQSTMKYIGCTAGELREHLERKFEKWMTWENYGTRWHIDHIHPVDSFDHSDHRQIAICWHYSNLRPLCALKNSSKGSRITIPQMNLPI